ncbi:MAG TPA: GNAT family N-acetyltransferase [Aliiroseovarius sp.]|nr:GNAT family N-acetyltransferase [Aliiroseovarius sp.]
MTIALTLAGPGDLDRLLPLVEACHAEVGIDLTDYNRRAGILPVLQSNPHGAIWLIGPPGAPVGYVAVGFGWSIEMGGQDAFIDEVFVDQAARRQGVGHAALKSLVKTLSRRGVKALRLEVAGDNRKARSLYESLGFVAREEYFLMTQVL